MKNQHDKKVRKQPTLEEKKEDYSLESNDSNATTKNATPAQNRSPPVKK